MTLERMLKLAILQLIKTEYLNSTMFGRYIEESYDLEKLDNDYIPLLEEFLNEYAK